MCNSVFFSLLIVYLYLQNRLLFNASCFCLFLFLEFECEPNFNTLDKPSKMMNWSIYYTLSLQFITMELSSVKATCHQGCQN